MASKLYGANATIIISVFALYCIMLNLHFPFMELFSPNLIFIIFLLCFQKAFKTLLFKQFVADCSGAVWNHHYTNTLIRLD